MKPRNLENDKRAKLVKKVIHTYAETTRNLGLQMDWSVWKCLYRKDAPNGKLGETLNMDVQSSRLYKRNKDGQNWSVLYHPLSQLWMNEKEDTFKIVFKTGRVVKFGLKEENKTPYIEGI